MARTCGSVGRRLLAKRPCSVWSAGPLLLLAGAGLHAQTVISFDEPGYAAGMPPPAPWVMNGAAGQVVAGAGVGGSQALGLETAIADFYLPTPLGPADGAQRISVKVDLPYEVSAASSYPMNFMKFGQLLVVGSGQVASVGWSMEDWDRQLPHQPGDFTVKISGGQTIGQFVPDQVVAFYEVLFDFAADWTSVTVTVRPPQGAELVHQLSWNGSQVGRMQFYGNDYAQLGLYGTVVTYYDDLVLGNVVVTPPTVNIRLVDGPAVLLSWPATYIGYILESASALPPAVQWDPVAGEPVIVGSDFVVTIPIVDTQRFFQLHKPQQ